MHPSSAPPPLLNTNIPNPSPSVLDWGIAIAVLLFIAKTGLDFFKEKDKSETELTACLISDLRNDARAARETQATTLARLAQLQEKTTENLTAVSKALDRLTLADQEHKRDVAVILNQQRQIEERLILVGGQLKAIHERLDKSGVPHAGGGEG
jgi:hypothetical protein